MIGLVLAIPLGWLANRTRAGRTLTINVAGLLYTIPSLALFVLLPPLLGTRILDPINVIVALTVYTVALLVRTVADALERRPAGGRQLGDRDGVRPAAPVRRRRAAARRSRSSWPGCGWPRCRASASSPSVR